MRLFEVRAEKCDLAVGKIKYYSEAAQVTQAVMKHRILVYRECNAYQEVASHRWRQVVPLRRERGYPPARSAWPTAEVVNHVWRKRWVSSRRHPIIYPPCQGSNMRRRVVVLKHLRTWRSRAVHKAELRNGAEFEPSRKRDRLRRANGRYGARPGRINRVAAARPEMAEQTSMQALV